MSSRMLVTPTVVGQTRVFRTQDGRLLSQSHLSEQPERYQVRLELEATRRLAISA